jgi:hypothetical protein
VADWGVIEATARTLVRLLEQRLRQAAITGVDILPLTTASFSDLAFSTSPVISLLLYQVMENPELRNRPRRVHPDGRTQRQPLALELCYLVTPWGSRSSDPSVDDDSRAALEEASLLGLILQAFYDHAEVGTADLFEDPARPVWRAGDNLQIVLESLPVEDHYRIWDASELGYRLSVTYRVRVASLDSAEIRHEPPVVEATFEGSE